MYNIEEFVSRLSREEKKHLIQLLSVDDMNETSRFENGNYCPYCHTKHVIKKGIIRKHQRFYCLECKKYYTVYAKTILNYTKKDIVIWKNYIKMMFAPKPKTLKQIAQELSICYRTAFNWRHKILKMLNDKFMNDNLQGIVEADETFILTSHKGQHITGVKARKRGGASRYRGLSHEQTGVLVAVDRNKDVVSEVYGTGKISDVQVVKVLSNRIDKESLLITDGCVAYKNFAWYENLKLKQLKAGKSQGNGIHLNNVNSYHSRLKRFLYGFNGISTKYLNHYLAWFKFIQQKNNDCGFLFNNLILQ